VQAISATHSYRLVLSTSIGDLRKVAVSGQKAFFAGRHFSASELLTPFHPTSEWGISQPYVCNYRSQQCLGMIRGARHLSEQQATDYRLNRHIVDKRNLKG